MTNKLMIEVSRQQLEYWMVMLRNGLPETVSSMIQTVLEVPEAPRQEPMAWANDQQLLLCSKSPREDQPNNPMVHNLPRNIAGSAMKTDYCNTPLYAAPLSPDHSGGGAGMVLQERWEFEKWVRTDWPDAPLRYVRDALPEDDPRFGEYCDEHLQRAWVGWQARAALDKVKELNQ